jgi:hypothetical protein
MACINLNKRDWPARLLQFEKLAQGEAPDIKIHLEKIYG